MFDATISVKNLTNLSKEESYLRYSHAHSELEKPRSLADRLCLELLRLYPHGFLG